MAVTKAQIAAGRAANQAYKAAQASGNTSQASNIVSNAAKALGVSSGSSAYQSAMSKASSIQAPKIEQPKVDSLPNIQQPQQQQNYNLQNLQNLQNPNQRSNIFGDIYGNERQTYTGEGIKLSTGDIVKDKTQLGEIKNINDYMKFGKAAQDIESKEKGFIERRNDAIIMDIFKSSPKVTQENVDKLVIDYIKAKDKDGSLYTGDRGEADVQNTLASIKSRMGYIPSERDLLTEKATDAYDREITDIKSQYDAEKSAFMKAGAIEDRYTNFNEVNDKIQSTLEAAGKHRAENLYTGMPTDEQISEIAQGLGQDFNSTKKILEGRGFEDLEMQGEFKEKSERPYERMFEDLELNRNRTLADIETKHVRTQTALNEQVDDVKTQMERTLAVGEKAGALSGAIRSSGYVQGLDNIRQDAIKNMDRLKVRKDWDTEDTAMNKGRVIEDFNTNMTRAKQDLETTMNEIKTTNGAALGQYLNQYAPSSSELTRKLNELEDTFAVKSQAAFSNYMANLRGITDTMTYDTEKALQLEGMKQQLQQTNVSNLLANNGMALAGINYGDLSTMLKSGDISPTDYTAMAGYMKTLGISQLQSMGIPAPQDFTLYNQMLEQGMTPQQAIASITSSNPSRYNALNPESIITNTQYNNTQQPIDRNAIIQDMKGGMFNNMVRADDAEGAAKYVASIPDGTLGGQCGYAMNNVSQALGIGKLFGNKLSDKTNQINSKTAKIGSFVVMDSATSPEYGHVGMVVGIDGNNLIVKSSNYGGDEKWRTDKIPMNSKSIKGYVDVAGKLNPMTGQEDSGPTTQQTQTSSEISQIKSDIKLIESGLVNKSDIQGIQDAAYKNGMGEEFDKAMNKGAKYYITDTQRDQLNKTRDEFRANPVVKGFEEGLTQFENLGFALSQESGPGDMAAIFQFMKTLDPTSVVRESEYMAAAESAGKISKWKNMYNKLSKGDLLTPQQTEEFRNLATEFIMNKAKSYERLYNDMTRDLEYFNIDKELRPTNATQQLLDYGYNSNNNATGGTTIGGGTTSTGPVTLSDIFR